MRSAVNVLVVDDDAGIRLLCRINLQLDGHTVVEAASLTSARQALAEHPVDVVLLDLHVGGEDGLAFLEELRRERPGLPVALLTGDSRAADAPRDAADALIPKPFTLEHLRDTVTRLGPAGG